MTVFHVAVRSYQRLFGRAPNTFIVETHRTTHLNATYWLVREANTNWKSCPVDVLVLLMPTIPDRPETSLWPVSPESTHLVGLLPAEVTRPPQPRSSHQPSPPKHIPTVGQRTRPICSYRHLEELHRWLKHSIHEQRSKIGSLTEHSVDLGYVNLGLL